MKLTTVVVFPKYSSFVRSLGLLSIVNVLPPDIVVNKLMHATNCMIFCHKELTHLGLKCKIIFFLPQVCGALFRLQACM